MRLAFYVFLAAAALAGSLFLYPKVKQWFAIDACLDRGGRWNYETKECETFDSQPAANLSL